MRTNRLAKLCTWVAVALMNILPAFTCHDNFLNAAEPPVKRDITLTGSQRLMIDKNNDFACNLFRTISEQKHGESSTLVSPISVSYMLGMLNDGADGETYLQISNVLGMGGSVEEMNKYFKKMIDEAPRVDTKVTVKIANSINVNSAQGISLVPQYEADMRKYYNAQVDALDFSDGESLRHINNWCNDNTYGLIPKILDRLEPSAAMYLLNAVYFKASWTNKFNSNATRDLTFTKQDGSTVTLKMMHLKTRVSYGEDNLCKMLCLPSGSGGYSMYVLLPKQGHTIGDIIQSLTARKLKQIKMHTTASHEVDILMPRFTTTNETNLKDVLSSMGMPRVFDSYSAQFSNMANGGDDLYVSMMKQKAKIIVDEEGTKAAAVTVAEMRNRSSISSGYTFHATHPFVYYIVEGSTGTIFFMGTYCGD